MTVDAAPVGAPATTDGSPTGSTHAATSWRRARPVVVVVALVLLAAVLGLLALPRSAGEPLDPDNPRPRGSRAVARVLRAQGVDVQRVTRSTELRTRARAGDTVLVTHSELLGESQLAAVRESPAGLVLVEPGADVLQALLPEVALVGATRDHDVVDAQCSAGAATVAGPARGGGLLYAPARPEVAADASYCYPAADGAGYSWVFATAGRDRPVVISGQSGAFTNDHVDQAGNAALVLRSLGRGDRLLWYLPDPLEAGSEPDHPTLRDLAPRWVGWLVAQLAVTVLVTMLWRGRRLGPLVAEPLPVVVRAVETTQGRARLYRRSRARGRAAAVLRTATLRRLAARLDAPTGAAPEAVADAAAALAGWHPGRVRALLLGTAPRNDQAFAVLARDLDRLESEVARAASGGPRSTPTS